MAAMHSLALCHLEQIPQTRPRLGFLISKMGMPKPASE